MHYVVCARYRDPVIRPSMDSMIFRNGAGGVGKKRPWTRPDSNDHTVGPCAFFFLHGQRDTMPRDSTIVRNKVVCDRALNAPQSVSFYSFFFPYASFLFDIC